MATKLEKESVSITTQTEHVKSPILWQCLYVIRNVAEFRNLAFRITRTRSDVELVVVYREGVSGIFGPPLDPITLTLDPKGRCLVAILFKPVQRVSIVSAESGQIEIASLLAVLRMVAGKGYLFCPGLPERFLAGKACGKFVVLHRIPFKRYQSTQCPVYYQAPVLQPESNKASLSALCPRCMQTARWIQTLPVFAPNSAAAIPTQPQVSAPALVPTTAQLPVFGQLASDAKSTSIDDGSSNGSVKRVITDTPTSVTRLLSLASSYSTSALTKPSASQIVTVNVCHSGAGRQIPSVDVNGNSRVAEVVLKRSSSAPAPADVTASPDAREARVIQAVSDSIRSILQELTKKRMQEAGTVAGASGSSAETRKVSQEKSKDKKLKGNVCRQCKKQFSTPASLLNHLQRHEGISGSWKKSLRERKAYRKPSASAALVRMIHRGTKVRSTLQRKRAGQVSETSLRLFLKCLSDMVPSQNGAKSFKQGILPALKTKKMDNATADSRDELNRGYLSDGPSGKESSLQRPALKRSSSGLSAMQTLLEAAAMAGGGPEDISNPTATSSAAASTTSRSPASSTGHTDDSEVPHKKPRKSTRLASKRAKGKHKQQESEDDSSEAGSVQSPAVSHDSSLLTNLNLLSTVSLEKAFREDPPHSLTPTTISSTPTFTVLSPPVKSNMAAFLNNSSTTVPTSAFSGARSVPSTSPSVSISQHMLNNTSGGNVVMINKSQEKLPLTGASAGSNSNLPPLPPLIFAGGMHKPGQVQPPFPPVSVQQKHGQASTVPGSPSSILRNLVTINNSQSISTLPTVASPVVDMSKNHSSNNDCGAIDLSKPKSAVAAPKPPVTVEKSLDLSAISVFPHNFAQLVADNDNPVEMLQYLLMMSQKSSAVPAQKEAPPSTAVPFDKHADSDLQARMFASARNYKLNKPVKAAPQVQAVIASTSRVAQAGKGPRPAGGQGDEIQCGYKWSGSGGLVKERTQMVRELVPSDVMANFLTKPRLPVPVPQQPISMNMNQSGARQVSPQVVHAPPAEQTPSLTKPPDLSAPSLALNLTTSRGVEAPSPRKGGPGRPRKSANVVSTSSPTTAWSPTSPGNATRSILRTSLQNPAALFPQLVGNNRLPVPADTSVTSNASPQRMQQKAMNLSQTSSPSPSSHPTTPTSPSNCSISSPSLAAMLRQPAASTQEVNHSEARGKSKGNSGSPITTLQISRYPMVSSGQGLSLPGGVEIKAEPRDTASPEDGMIIMSLPVKAERRDATEKRNKNDNETGREGDSSPTNLVMDLSDTPCTRDGTEPGKKVNSVTRSRTNDLESNNATVKCEH